MHLQAEIICINGPVRAHLEGALDSYFNDMTTRKEMAERQRRMYEDMIRTGAFEEHMIPVHDEEHARELIDIENWIVQDSDRLLLEIRELAEIVNRAPACETNGTSLLGGGQMDKWHEQFEVH